MGHDDHPTQDQSGAHALGEEPTAAARQLQDLLAEVARAPHARVDEVWRPGPQVGDVVGRFELRRELGRGGFGVVFEAFDRELARAVGFKAIKPGTRVTGRSEEWLKREAEAVARLNHPNIVTLHDLGRGPAGPYLIFELLRGETLAERLRAGRLPRRDAVRVAVEVARALAHAHAAGVVHRDLKPANVFLCEDGVVKVLDFGLAHLFGRGRPSSAGTPAYMAPEQWRHEPGDERTDLFALGTVLHQMLAGELPYRMTREGSEALSPGPAPGLPARAGPSRLRKLVQAMLQRDPAQRPSGAQPVLDELVSVARELDGGGWGRRLVLLGAFAAAVAGATSWLLVGEGGPPPERTVVAVADFENATGDRDLDGLGGLLATSLEQSRRLQIVTRSRLFDLARRLGLGAAERLDAQLAREASRLGGAQALLLGSVRALGGGYRLELRGLEPGGETTLFSARVEAAEKALVPDALDRLSDAVRRALRERREDIQGSRVRVGAAVTGNLEAYRHYYAGLDCIDRPGEAGWYGLFACADHFRRALAVEPAFALAHYQLAFVLGTEQGASGERASHMAAALRNIEQAPVKEQGVIRAWKAHLDGKDDEALAIYGKVLAAFPEDERTLYLAGDLLHHQGSYAEALPYFLKALALDPDAEFPLDHAVQDLGTLGRREELRGLVGQQVARPVTAARARAIVQGQFWLGRPDEALAAARRAWDVAGAAAGLDLVRALAATGRFAEAERALREGRAAGPEQVLQLALATAVAAQGRRREALALVDAIAGGLPPAERAPYHWLRANHLAGDGDARGVWREAARAQALDAPLAATLAVTLAFLGDLEHASRLAPSLTDATAAEEYRALAAWRSGEKALAAAWLEALDARDPRPETAMFPSFLLAEVSADAGDPAGTIAAVERFHSLVPKGYWPSWTYPRSLLLLARAQLALGERARARETVGRLLALWGGADPGLPLLREARRLRASLGP